MRIYITSTPEELEPHQMAACDVATELGHQPLLRDPTFGRGLRRVAACTQQVQRADAVFAILGHRRGRVPPPALGGDGSHPWSWWETRAAFDRGLPVTVLMASDDWQPDLREDGAGARSVMSDLRGELVRLAIPFNDEPGAGFRQLVRRQLAAMVRESASFSEPEVGLRRWPPSELPARPYPLLLPYAHPDLLAGRDRELAELRQLLGRPVPILGLHAPSGTGKSSFLYAGLVQTLRAEGWPVAFDRHSSEPGLVRRLLGDLLEDGRREIADADLHTFVERLRDVLRLAERPAVLVLDQLEDLFQVADGADARAVLGPLLAASVQRQPGLSGPLCQWLLAYRQEFHGEVFQWLDDVLGDARRRTDREGTTLTLPHSLTGGDRFRPWPLAPLGTPAPGTEDLVEAAAATFQAAIEKPIALTSPEGERIYRWRFASDSAARLARAFGEARVARPDAPLAPELQVVLAHLLATASRVEAEGVVWVDVPEDPGELIDRALEEHLKRSLDLAFPADLTGPTKLRRTRALLALRELADVHGRRHEGVPTAALARAIGTDGREVLERLATPQTRVVLLKLDGDEQVYVLSHDRMAEVIVRLVDDQGAYAGFGVNGELLDLRRFVALQRELFASGESEQATEVPKSYYASIERHVDALLWDDEGRHWWDACRERRRLDRRRKAIRRGGAAAVLVFLALLAGVWADRYFERQALLETIVEGEPEAAFAVLARLTDESNIESEEYRARVQRRERPFDVLERGLGGVGEARGPALLRVAELLQPLVGEDPVRIASTVWALDFFAIPDSALREQAIALRNQILTPLRRRRPPPPKPLPEDPAWANIPAGSFWMGAGPGEGRDNPKMQDEFPRHQVTLSAYRLMVHEVTNAEFRRLWSEHGSQWPDYQGEDDQPANRMNWYEAYAYAAWLGGRLPTESEWEYAARAGCAYAYCLRDGSEATLDEVAWWVGNSADPETGEPALKPVMELEPNPWGLWDVYGNVWEWNATWYRTYPQVSEKDPSGPTDTVIYRRTNRGGSIFFSDEWVAASARGADVSSFRRVGLGLRVLIVDPRDQ